MKKRMTFLVVGLILMVMAASCAQAEVERNPILDTAFSCLEKDNIFLRRYNELTGADVQPLFEAGIPYFFGGQDTKKLFASYPHYAQRDCLESAGHYIKGEKYLFGFDCSGFCRYVYAENDLGDIDTLSNMILHHRYYPKEMGGDGSHLYNHRTGMPPYEELAKELQVGDLLVGKFRARHILMFIGTLRDYGFTEEELGEALAPYIDYPLAIHCGPNPQYEERIQQVIDGNSRYRKCTTTDGGVAVSIIGVPLDKTTHQVPDGNTTLGYFLIDNDSYWLTSWDVGTCTSYCWFRKVQEKE